MLGYVRHNSACDTPLPQSSFSVGQKGSTVALGVAELEFGRSLLSEYFSEKLNIRGPRRRPSRSNKHQPPSCSARATISITFLHLRCLSAEVKGFR